MQTTAKKTDSKPVAMQTASVAAATRPRKLSYKEQRELEELPKLIAQLEEEQAAIAARLADPDLYRQGPDEALRLNARFTEIDAILLNSLERWEAIEARQKM